MINVESENPERAQRSYWIGKHWTTWQEHMASRSCMSPAILGNAIVETSAVIGLNCGLGCVALWGGNLFR